MGIVPRFLARTEPLPGAEALDVGHAKAVSSSVKNDVARKPADGDETLQFRFTRLETDHRHRVLRSVADVQCPAPRVKHQSVRTGPERILRPPFHQDRLNDLIRGGLQHAHRVAGRVGHGQKPAVRRQGQAGSVQAGQDFPSDRAGAQINHRDRAFARHVHAPGPPAPRFAFPGRAGQRSGLRPAPAPVAHVGLSPVQNDLVRLHSAIKETPRLARGQIDLDEPVREIENDIQEFPVRRKGPAPPECRSPRTLAPGHFDRVETRRPSHLPPRRTPSRSPSRWKDKRAFHPGKKSSR